MESHNVIDFLSFENTDNIFIFTTRKDMNEAANIITDGRYYNCNDVYIYICPYCEGFGFVNEGIVFYEEGNQWLYGELCFECGGRGKLTFTEYFMSQN